MMIPSEQLFMGTPVNLESKVDKAPLSPLQGYVIEQLPEDLRAVREEEMTYEQLAAKQDKVVQVVQDEIVLNTDPRQAKVTQLDLHFMLNGYLPKQLESFRQAPPILRAAIEQQHDRTGVPARMDYDLIVDVNSAEYERTGLARVYTQGEVAADERDFYIGHSAAEVYVKDAAYELHRMAQTPEQTDPSTVLAAARDNVEVYGRYIAAYGRLSRENFGLIRTYLSSYPDGIRNASGAFMPSPQLLETALHAPTEGYTTYVNESMPYFPEWSRPVIKGWYETSKNGKNIEAQLEAGNLELTVEDKDILVNIVEIFKKSRMTHSGVTFKQIPQAFQDSLPLKASQLKVFGERPIVDPSEANRGTGGFDVTNVLGNSIYRLMQLQDRLQQM